MEQAPTLANQSEKSKPKERAFYARLGAAALTAVMLATPMTTSTHAKAFTTKVEASDTNSDNIPSNASSATSDDAPGTIYDTDGNIIYKPSSSTSQAPIPIITLTKSSAPIKKSPVDISNPSLTPLEPLGLSRPSGITDLPSTTTSSSNNPKPSNLDSTSTVSDTTKAWDGKALNAKDGHIDGPSGDETYYNLPMDEIVDRMHRMGVKGEYWVREDGVKMLGNYVIVAANLTIHPRGSIVETSLGPGIVCDTGSFAEKHPNRLDIATNW